LIFKIPGTFLKGALFQRKTFSPFRLCLRVRAVFGSKDSSPGRRMLGRRAWTATRRRAAARGFAGGALPAADSGTASSQHKWIGRAVFAVRGHASACVSADEPSAHGTSRKGAGPYRCVHGERASSAHSSFRVQNMHYERWCVPAGACCRDLVPGHVAGASIQRKGPGDPGAGIGL